MLPRAVFRGCNNYNTGIVDQYVEPAVTFHYRIDDLFPGSLVGDVVNHELLLAARFRDRFGGGFTGPFIDVGEDHGRACTRQNFRVSEPQAGSCAGDDGDFVSNATRSNDSLGFGRARPGKSLPEIISQRVRFQSSLTFFDVATILLPASPVRGAGMTQRTIRDGV